MDQTWMPKYKDDRFHQRPAFSREKVQKAYHTAMLALQMLDMVTRSMPEQERKLKAAEARTEVRKYINTAASDKRGLHKAAALGFGIGYYRTVYRVELEYLVLFLVAVWGIVFEWTETYPHSVSKPLAIKLSGTFFKVLRLIPFGLCRGVMRKVWEQ
ncbi:hypothetical protein BDZ91DRAFT_835268 [Kalaharituber pfeilii]|nr:hypothetical protein BDZ91DRAFT_835268 [Kalaharituber pfeilii]